jgi:hypothetical protein
LRVASSHALLILFGVCGIVGAMALLTVIAVLLAVGWRRPLNLALSAYLGSLAFNFATGGLSSVLFGHSLEHANAVFYAVMTGSLVPVFYLLFLTYGLQGPLIRPLQRTWLRGGLLALAAGSVGLWLSRPGLFVRYDPSSPRGSRRARGGTDGSTPSTRPSSRSRPTRPSAPSMRCAGRCPRPSRAAGPAPT